MADLATLRERLAVNLRTIPALATRTFAYEPATKKEPLAWIGLSSPAADYDTVFGRVSDWYFTVTVIASRAAGDPHAQAKLDPFLSTTGTSSVIRAIETDVTLAGNAHLLIVDEPDTEPIDDGDLQFVGARWRVRVTA